MSDANQEFEQIVEEALRIFALNAVDILTARPQINYRPAMKPAAVRAR